MPSISDPGPEQGAAELATLMVFGRDQRVIELVRGEDGLWRYDGTLVLVPGAIDVPLSAVIEAWEVAPPGGPPVSVLIRRTDVERNPELAWVLEVGRLLKADGDGEDFYQVDWPAWQEHAGKPIGVRAPENDDVGLRRLLAVEERELRFARRRSELITERRARLVMIASALGMTRREVSELLGLSVGRVQQMLDDAPAPLRVEVDDLLRDAVAVFRSIGQQHVQRAELGHGQLIDELVAFGLLSERGGLVKMTDAGDQAEIHLRGKAAKRGRS